jgi:hypothetical protein
MNGITQILWLVAGAGVTVMLALALAYWLIQEARTPHD